MSTKPDTDTGWSKEFPSLRYGSWFWLRDAPDAEPRLVQLCGGYSFYEPMGIIGPNTEYLGPISPSDFEQLIRLRGACEAAEQRLADNERWWNQEEIASEVPESYRQAFKARAQVTRNTLDQIREALTRTGEQS